MGALTLPKLSFSLFGTKLFAESMLFETIAVALDVDHFGGIAYEFLYDNPRTVVLSRDFEGRDIRWNPLFWDFSAYWGFRPRACRPYRAQTKGKVESGVKYVKRFLRGKAFDSLDHLNDALINWIATVADERIHGTTHRRPSEMFLEEKDLLLDHRGRPAYPIQERALRHVAKDCLVSFDTNRYSVPFRFVGKPVEVSTDGEGVRIYHDGELIATHPICEGRYRCRTDRHHYAGIYHRETPEVGALRFPPIDTEVQVRDLAFYQSLVEGGAR